MSQRFVAALTYTLFFPFIAMGETVHSLDAIVDSGVRVVSRQIHAATRPSADATRSLWASQPGALRRVAYPNGAAEEESIFKLFSSPILREGVGDLASDLPNNWQAQASNYVDLNAGESDGNGGLKYPIADPRADAEGFSVDNGFPGVVPGNALPMPVRWLYQLQDGTLGYLSDGIFQALENQPSGLPSGTPSAVNPMVGRLAFWTDDLSCKINVNTASEGVFWDTPRCDTAEERHYAKYQPYFLEHQREMGHPAAVSLSSVLFPGKRFSPRGGSGNMGALALAEAKSLWALSPTVYETHGSVGGTVIANFEGSVTSVLKPDERLTSLDQISISSLPEESKLRASRGSFFLTTHNRAADYTTEGEPRISLWPIRSDFVGNLRSTTEFDANMAKATTIGVNRYFVHREDPGSRIREWKTSNGGRINAMFQWLVTGLSKPSFGSANSFQQKYGGPSNGSSMVTDANALSLMALDYIRAINFRDPFSLAPFVSQQNAAGVSSLFNTDQVAYLNTWSDPTKTAERGFGTVPGLSEIILWMTCRAEKIAGGSIVGTPTNFSTLNSKSNGTKELEIGFLAEISLPKQGPGGLYPVFCGEVNFRSNPLPSFGTPWIQFSGLPVSQSFALPTPPSSPASNFTSKPPDWTQTGGNGGPRVAFTAPIISGPLYVSMPTGINFTMAFKASQSSNTVPPVRFHLMEGSSPSTGNLFMVAYLNVPSITAPAPEVTLPMATRMTQAIQGATPLFNPSKDVVRSFVPVHGDYRMVHTMNVHALDSSVFVPHPNWASTNRIVHSLNELGTALPDAISAPMLEGITYPAGKQPDFILPASNPGFSAGRLDSGIRGSCDPKVTGDWDNGTGPLNDGPWANFPDEGDVRGLPSSTPYFDTLAQAWTPTQRDFSAHRMIPSAVMFGSLPSGTKARVPWQTLLFRPDPNQGTSNQHYGSTGPKDHVFLDRFRMPVVTPWLISDQLSQAGAINLNYQMQPFRHIKRATALHALLKAQKILAIPTGTASIYKTGAGEQPWRRFIDPEKTLAQWEAKFATNKLFLRSSEICEQWLVPEGGALANMPAFWAAHLLTGDNSKERPYANLYPHLTTRSNSYEIHVLAQTIQKSDQVAANVFDPALDIIVGTKRETVQLERSIDANDPSIPDYVTAFQPPSLDTFAKVAVLRAPTDIHLPKQILLPPSSGDNTFHLQWSGLRYGEKAVVETSQDLVHWAPVATVVAGDETTPGSIATPTSDGGEIAITPSATEPKQFYRINMGGSILPEY